MWLELDGAAGKEAKDDNPTRRFSDPCSSSQMEQICWGYVPKNMSKATNWALHGGL